MSRTLTGLALLLGSCGFAQSADSAGKGTSPKGTSPAKSAAKPAPTAPTKNAGTPTPAKRPKKPPTPSVDEAATILKRVGYPGDLALSAEQRQRLGQVVAEHEPALTATFKELADLDAENKRYRKNNGGRIGRVPIELDHPTYGLRKGLLDAKLKRQARELRRDIRNLLTEKQRARLPAEGDAEPTPLEKLEELIRTYAR